MSAGAEVNALITSSQATALHRAAFMGHCTVLRELCGPLRSFPVQKRALQLMQLCLRRIAAGADGLKQDADLETALHKAVKRVS